MPRPKADERLSPTEELTALGGSIASTTAVTEVTRRLLDFFTTGTVAPGDRLPPERQLRRSMGVGRSAVREALAALEVLGVVDVRPGSGTYLRGRASELLPQTLSWGILIGEPRPANSSTSGTDSRCKRHDSQLSTQARLSSPSSKTS
jgi:DNA-binding transcriptional MocR family regulator